MAQQTTLKPNALPGPAYLSFSGKIAVGKNAIFALFRDKRALAEFRDKRAVAKP